MGISFELTCPLSEADVEMLCHALGSSDTGELSDNLKKVATAATNEYLDMILGRNLPTRADEMRERRVYYLIKHYFGDRFPTESEICQLFQTTESRSRTLLRNVRAKYKFEVQEHIRNSVESALSTAEENKEKDYHVVTINSENVLEEMKQTIARNAPELEQITKKRNSAGLYVIPDDTFNILKKEYCQDTNGLKVVGG